MEMSIYILCCVCVLLFVVLIALILYSRFSYESLLKTQLLENEKNKQKDLMIFKDQFQDDLNELKDRMNHDLLVFQNTVMHSIREDMSILNESTSRRLNRMELSVADSLMKGFDKTSQSFHDVVEQMTRIDETQKNLQKLSENIISLESILTDKKSRGTFGEIELYSLMESVFGLDGQRYLKQVKLSNGYIADCIMKAPLPLGNLVIDSKFPLENYNRMIDEKMDPQMKKKASLEFKKDVKNHIQTISEKYLIPGETAEFACMFIPAEAVFAEIAAHYEELIQFSYQKKVYLVSPTTMMAYLSAIKAFYLNQERSLKVVEIQNEYARLSKEFERFVQRWQLISRDFEKLSGDMRNLDITSDKIIRRFQQIESVDLQSAEDEDTKKNHLYD